MVKITLRCHPSKPIFAIRNQSPQVTKMLPTTLRYFANAPQLFAILFYCFSDKAN